MACFGCCAGDHRQCMTRYRAVPCQWICVVIPYTILTGQQSLSNIPISLAFFAAAAFIVITDFSETESSILGGMPMQIKKFFVERCPSFMFGNLVQTAIMLGLFYTEVEFGPFISSRWCFRFPLRAIIFFGEFANVLVAPILFFYWLAVDMPRSSAKKATKED
mmetsp:Transcript_10540/g.22210  ORF Transcript_10540/g.22210 Transcript_10540/m.22210 type:complete len:163 (+) Transcript_10540:58-546(+)